MTEYTNMINLDLLSSFKAKISELLISEAKAREAADAELKTKIITTEDDSLSITMDHNTETRCGFISELTLALPEDIPEDYISSVVFTSVDESLVNLVYPESIYMTGEGCIDGVFVPQSNMRYTIIVLYDGQYISGMVGGVPV